ncbi:hypothetical protein T492DRAFT_939273 [Pavlovales sp. CCMP2436]|nr:hypothetical protein T492DRAFT_939273 [Pavlovales sp. CCMP2436]|mmetsp:Transcript_27467/g.69341  ORF Transcript_27467/g.69341 Transcript_27467/m.69341 type:complete len:153 (-) Transcript_27467:73-531(-)
MLCSATPTADLKAGRLLCGCSTVLARLSSSSKVDLHLQQPRQHHGRVRVVLRAVNEYVVDVVGRNALLVAELEGVDGALARADAPPTISVEHSAQRRAIANAAAIRRGSARGDGRETARQGGVAKPRGLVARSWAGAEPPRVLPRGPPASAR